MTKPFCKLLNVQCVSLVIILSMNFPCLILNSATLILFLFYYNEKKGWYSKWFRLL